MKRSWFIEKRGFEIWAWLLHPPLFLRLNCSGRGTIVNLENAQSEGEFVWGQRISENDFLSREMMQWVETLDFLLDKPDSDLSFSHRFASLNTNEREWEKIQLLRGERALLEMCVKSVVEQHEEFVYSLNVHPATKHSLVINLEVSSIGLINWRFSHHLIPIRDHPRLSLKLDCLFQFFGFKLNREKLAIYTALYFTKTNVNIAFLPDELSAHEKMENSHVVRELLLAHLPPENLSL